MRSRGLFVLPRTHSSTVTGIMSCLSSKPRCQRISPVEVASTRRVEASQESKSRLPMKPRLLIRKERNLQFLRVDETQSRRVSLRKSHSLSVSLSPSHTHTLDSGLTHQVRTTRDISLAPPKHVVIQTRGSELNTTIKRRESRTTEGRNLRRPRKPFCGP